MYSFSLITLDDLKKINYSCEFPGIQAEWIIDWYSTFKQKDDNDLGIRKKPYIVTVYKVNTLVAIVPLMKLTRTYLKIFSLQFLEFLGQQWSGMGYDIIKIRKLEDCFANELVAWLKKNISYHFLFLKYLPDSSELKSKFRFFRYAGAPYVKPTEFSNYEQFSQNVYSRKFREDLRRTLRRIKKDGFDLVVEQRDINDESLEVIRRISASKLTDGKSNLYTNNLKQNFHMKIYKQCQSKVIFLKLNGEAVAYGTSIDFNGQRIGVDAAFDRNFRKYGVGIQCVDQVIRESFKDGIRKLSFGLGMDTYKFQFTNCIDEFFMCYDYKISFKSLLVLALFHYKIKKINNQVSNLIDSKREVLAESKNEACTNKVNLLQSVDS